MYIKENVYWNKYKIGNTVYSQARKEHIYNFLL